LYWRGYTDAELNSEAFPANQKPAASEFYFNFICIIFHRNWLSNYPKFETHSGEVAGVKIF